MGAAQSLEAKCQERPQAEASGGEFCSWKCLHLYLAL